MTLIFLPFDPGTVASLRAGGADVNGQPAERAISSGEGTPCRSCLNNVPAGAEMLICAARPFPALQPYAETGPIFLCADACKAWHGTGLPPVLQTSPDYLLKAYNDANRIIYGTGQITLSGDIDRYVTSLFDRDEVAYVDVRSARNNCFLTRVTRHP